MIEVSNTVAQTLQPGQAVSFDNIIHRKGCGECYTKQLPTSVKLRGGCGSVYNVEFNGNVSGTEGDILRLFIALEGQPLAETEMRVVPSGATNSANISSGTYVVLSCDDVNRISVMNGGTTAIGLAPNANLRIRRVG